MTDLDTALAEVWDATSTEDGSSEFEAELLRRIARCRAVDELISALIVALAVCVLAWALSPAAGLLASAIATVAAAPPVMAALALIVIGLIAWALVRLRLRPLALILPR